MKFNKLILLGLIVLLIMPSTLAYSRYSYDRDNYGRNSYDRYDNSRNRCYSSCFKRYDGFPLNSYRSSRYTVYSRNTRYLRYNNYRRVYSYRHSNNYRYSRYGRFGSGRLFITISNSPGATINIDSSRDNRRTN